MSGEKYDDDDAKDGQPPRRRSPKGCGHFGEDVFRKAARGYIGDDDEFACYRCSWWCCGPRRHCAVFREPDWEGRRWRVCLDDGGKLVRITTWLYFKGNRKEEFEQLFPTEEARVATRNDAYLIAGRLEDVLALIQVLGLDEHAHRSEEGLQTELQGKPASAASWTEVAKSHPEFFRVAEKAEHKLSLIVRHVSNRDEQGRRPIAVEFVQQLLETAVTIHDAQVKRSQKWTLYVPIWGAFITGLLGILAAAIKFFPGASGG